MNPQVYIKNPESSELGKRIITGSIDMIHDLGFEQFTFRKLGKKIGTTEASIYRYFESKYKLLLYIISWYWGWIQYRLAFAWANVESPETRLQKAILLLTEQAEHDSDFSHINEVKLGLIVISDASKAYLNKHVDEENNYGAFSSYKQLVAEISRVILEINPAYKYPNMLVSTMIEGAHLQHYFADHLPRLTNVKDDHHTVTEFYEDMVFRAIQPTNNAPQ